MDTSLIECCCNPGFLSSGFLPSGISDPATVSWFLGLTALLTHLGLRHTRFVLLVIVPALFVGISDVLVLYSDRSVLEFVPALACPTLALGVALHALWSNWPAGPGLCVLRLRDTAHSVLGGGQP